MAELLKKIIGRGHKKDQVNLQTKIVITDLTLDVSKYHDGIIGKQCIKIKISDNQDTINLKREQVIELISILFSWLIKNHGTSKDK